MHQSQQADVTGLLMKRLSGLFTSFCLLPVICCSHSDYCLSRCVFATLTFVLLYIIHGPENQIITRVHYLVQQRKQHRMHFASCGIQSPNSHLLRQWWWWARCWPHSSQSGSWRTCGCCRWMKGEGRWWWPGWVVVRHLWSFVQYPRRLRGERPSFIGGTELKERSNQAKYIRTCCVRLQLWVNPLIHSTRFSTGLVILLHSGDAANIF